MPTILDISERSVEGILPAGENGRAEGATEFPFGEETELSVDQGPQAYAGATAPSEQAEAVAPPLTTTR